jgi:hypothetical protein
LVLIYIPVWEYNNREVRSKESLPVCSHLTSGEIEMVSSSAQTVKEYLEELPEERREVISRVRELILINLPEGYQESMNWGMITYEIPLEDYPNTYNGQPLGYVALAAQKNYYSLYLMGCYQDSEGEARLREGFQQAGKNLNMGKSCLRFKQLEDLPLGLLGEIIAGTDPEKFIEIYENARKPGRIKK